MARLSDMLNREVSLRFNFDGEAFELRYAPFNQTVVDDLLTSDETRDQARFNVRLLAKVLRGWDITDDSGHALPLTEESIAQLPMWCQNLLVSRIMEDQQVGKTERRVLKRYLATGGLYDDEPIPEWFSWIEGCRYLGLDPLTAHNHPAGAYWVNRALAILDAKAEAEAARERAYQRK